MAKTEREQDRHAAGGPGKSARKGHVEPEKSGNKESQRQPGPVGLPGEGRARRGSEWRERGKTKGAR